MATPRAASHRSTTKNGGEKYPAINGNAEARMGRFDESFGAHEEMIERLNRDLLNARNENRQLVDALRSLHSQFNSLQMHTDKQAELLLSGGEELQETKQQLVSLQRELARTKEECDELQEKRSRQGCTGTSTVKSDGEAGESALKGRRQELEQYADSHNREESRSSRKFRDHGVALAGMEQALREWKAASTAQERNNAELALKIKSLERRCAELDGRRGERESTCEDLRTTFDTRAREVELLSKSVRRMQKELAELASGMGTGRSGAGPRQDKPAASGEGKVAIRSEPAASAKAAKRHETKPWWFGGEDEKTSKLSRYGKRQEQAGSHRSSGKFIVVSVGPEEPESRYPVDKKVLTIGRSRDNDIPVVQRSVSRLHARIVRKGPQIFIEDMGSRNGILVNSKRKDRQELKHGDTFTVGFSVFELLDATICGGAPPIPPAA